MACAVGNSWSAGHRTAGGPLTRFPLKPSAYPPATRSPAHSKPSAIHGGTVRVTLARDTSGREITPNVQYFIDLELELGVGRFEWYAGWGRRVRTLIAGFAEQLVGLKLAGKKISAFAASSKGNTLLNSANIGTDVIDYIVDETPEKIGKFSPGTGIPIVHKQTLLKDPPDYLVILSWNFADEIMEKLVPIYHGQYIIPTDGTL